MPGTSLNVFNNIFDEEDLTKVHGANYRIVIAPAQPDVAETTMLMALGSQGLLRGIGNIGNLTIWKVIGVVAKLSHNLVPVEMPAVTFTEDPELVHAGEGITRFVVAVGHRTDWGRLRDLKLGRARGRASGVRIDRLGFEAHGINGAPLKGGKDWSLLQPKVPVMNLL
jgi:hypothetical protein